MSIRGIGGLLFRAGNRGARRLATRPFRVTMAAIPRHRRFGALLALARAIAPLAPRNGLGLVLHHRSPLESTRDIVFVQLLALLNRYRLPFDPEVAVEGIEKLDAAVAAGRGVLLAGPHTHVSIPTSVRYLHDSGYPLSAVTLGPFQRPVGKRSKIPEILHSPHFLLEVREALGQGRLVFAMIDRYTAVRGTVPVETRGGTVHVADALFRVAARCGARVVFLASRTESRRVSCTLDAPHEGSSDDYMREFARFIQAYAERR